MFCFDQGIQHKFSCHPPWRFNGSLLAVSSLSSLSASSSLVSLVRSMSLPPTPSWMAPSWNAYRRASIRKMCRGPSMCENPTRPSWILINKCRTVQLNPWLAMVFWSPRKHWKIDSWGVAEVHGVPWGEVWCFCLGRARFVDNPTAAVFVLTLTATVEDNRMSILIWSLVA